MFIKNAWYVACMPDDFQDKPLGRKVCGESMVFYRGAEGQAVALEDFCPHRGAPLSLGFVKDGNLVCGYHGLEMGCEGKTIAMPGQRVRGFPAIRSFPVVERYGFVWVWPGQADKASVDLLPKFDFFDNPAWAYGGGLYHIACDYRLMVDNLMDLTHETYVHASSIGQKEIDETPCKTTLEGEQVVTSRFMNGIEAPPFWKKSWWWLTHAEEPPPRIVSDGTNVLLDSERAGDEPYMLARNLPGVIVLVDKNRVKAGAYAIKRFGCDTLVLTHDHTQQIGSRRPLATADAGALGHMAGPQGF